MNTEKKVYEEPTVKMVEFDFSDRIAASSSCGFNGGDVSMSCLSHPSDMY